MRATQLHCIDQIPTDATSNPSSSVMDAKAVQPMNLPIYGIKDSSRLHCRAFLVAEYDGESEEMLHPTMFALHFVW